MTTAVTKGTLRLGEVGPEISGPAGSVLTFGADGRTLTGEPVPVPPAVSPARTHVALVGDAFAPIPPGSPGNITTTALSLPYSLESDEVLDIRIDWSIVTATLPAPASSYFNATMLLEISVDGQVTWLPVQSISSVHVLLAPPNPAADAPPFVPGVPLVYELTPLGAPPTGGVVWFRASFASNAASDDTFDARGVSFSFTQAKLLG
jgi:hypothetical protein